MFGDNKQSVVDKLLERVIEVCALRVSIVILALLILAAGRACPPQELQEAGVIVDTTPSAVLLHAATFLYTYAFIDCDVLSVGSPSLSCNAITPSRVHPTPLQCNDLELSDIAIETD